MAMRIKLLRPLGLALAFTFLVMPNIRQDASLRAQEASESDVCPAHWYKFNCTGIRLCVSPEMDRFRGVGHENLTDSIYGAAPEHDNRGACIEDFFSVPPAYTHASEKQLSFYAGYYDVVEAPMFMKVVKFDDADFSSEDSWSRALQRFKASFNDVEAHDQTAFREGQERRNEVLDTRAADAQLPLPTLPNSGESVREVCPSGSARFTCQFARLCISADVASRFANTLEKSGEFYFAKCKADTVAVPEASTHATPYMVGYAAGFRLLGPKYFKLVKVDSSYVKDDGQWWTTGINPALERANLSLLPPSAIQEYAKGWHDGNVEFQNFLNKAKQKAAESERDQLTKLQQPVQDVTSIAEHGDFMKAFLTFALLALMPVIAFAQSSTATPASDSDVEQARKEAKEVELKIEKANAMKPEQSVPIPQQRLDQKLDNGKWTGKEAKGQSDEEIMKEQGKKIAEDLLDNIKKGEPPTFVDAAKAAGRASKPSTAEAPAVSPQHLTFAERQDVQRQMEKMYEPYVKAIADADQAAQALAKATSEALARKAAADRAAAAAAALAGTGIQAGLLIQTIVLRARGRPGHGKWVVRRSLSWALDVFSPLSNSF